MKQELSKINHKVFKENLSSKNYEVYNSRKELIIKNISDKNHIVYNIHTFIHEAIMDKGVNMTPQEIDYLKLKVTDDIFRDFQTLTISDIKIAFHRGVRSEFGEYYGINAISLYGWLKSYKNEVLPVVNSEVKLLLNKVDIKEEVNPKEVEDYLFKSIIKNFIQKKMNNSHLMNDIGGIHYKFIDKLGLFEFNEEELLEYRDFAVRQFKSDLKEKNSKNLSLGKQYHLIDLEKTFHEIESGEKEDHNNSIQLRFENICLNKFLEKHLELKTDLQELIKEKLKNNP